MPNVRPLGYAGEFQDQASAAYPLGHGYRRFLPTLMRFNAADDDSPFGEGGLNTYGYCAGDPVNLSDPGGHAPLGAVQRFAFGALRLALADFGDIHLGHLIDTGDATSVAEDVSPARNHAAARIQRAWRRWRQRMGGGRRQDVERIGLTLLPRMGARPVESFDEFLKHVAAGRVIIEATGIAGTLREGHSSLYFADRVYDMDLSLAPFSMGPTATRQGGYSAKFTRRIDRMPQRAYISTSKTIGAMLHTGLFRMYRQYGMEHGLTFVLDPKYSPHFERAFRQEAFTFSHLPYGYGWYYNCHTFVRGVLERMLDLAD